MYALIRPPFFSPGHPYIESTTVLSDYRNFITQVPHKHSGTCVSGISTSVSSADANTCCVHLSVRMPPVAAPRRCVATSQLVVCRSTRSSHTQQPTTFMSLCVSPSRVTPTTSDAVAIRFCSRSRCFDTMRYW